MLSHCSLLSWYPMYPEVCLDLPPLDVLFLAKEARKLTTATVLQLSFGLQTRCQQ